MAALTAKDLWDTPNIIKYSALGINEAKTIIQNTEEIDELFEWLNKIGRWGFTSEEEIVRYTKQLLSELIIIESQNMIDSDPKNNSKDIILNLESLEEKIGELPPKAEIVKALAYAYLGDTEKCIEISDQIINNDKINKLYKSEACYASCYAGFKEDNEESWGKSVKWADAGITIMLQFIQEEKGMIICNIYSINEVCKDKKTS